MGMLVFFFFTDAATTEIYTLSLHDALPISTHNVLEALRMGGVPEIVFASTGSVYGEAKVIPRSEEHTSELQSRQYLVCRLLLEKKKNDDQHRTRHPSTIHTPIMQRDCDAAI